MRLNSGISRNFVQLDSVSLAQIIFVHSYFKINFLNEIFMAFVMGMRPVCLCCLLLVSVPVTLRFAVVCANTNGFGANESTQFDSFQLFYFSRTYEELCVCVCLSICSCLRVYAHTSLHSTFCFHGLFISSADDFYAVSNKTLWPYD